MILKEFSMREALLTSEKRNVERQELSLLAFSEGILSFLHTIEKQPVDSQHGHTNHFRVRLPKRRIR